MRKKAAIALNCIIIFLVFILMFVVCTFLPRTTESDYSLLKEFPKLTFKTLFDGTFFKGLTEWYTDTVFARDRFIDLNTKIKALYGIVPDEVVIIGDTSKPEEESEWNPGDESWGDVSEAPSAPEVSEPEESTVSEPSVSEPAVSKPEESREQVEEVISDVLILGNRAMEVYYGGEKSAGWFSEVINAYAEKVDGVQVYSMIIPKSCAYYISGSKTYGKYAGRTLRDLNAAAAALSEKVKNVNVYDILDAHKNDEIYFRTDHHWTALGAYYAVRQFAEVAGVTVPELAQYEKNVRTGYVGTMYKYTNYSPKLLNNPEDFVTYIPSAPYTATFYNQSMGRPRTHSIFFDIDDSHRSDWYSTFIAGDKYAVKIESTECKNGRKLLVVKDSYGNALAPFLVGAFEEIYIVDGRVFELNLVSFVKDNGITDVLFAECAYSAVGAYRKTIEALLQ